MGVEARARDFEALGLVDRSLGITGNVAGQTIHETLDFDSYTREGYLCNVPEKSPKSNDSAGIRPSPTSCPHFPECGGCQTLDQAYADQLAEKQNVVTSRLGGFTGLTIRDILPCSQPVGYRHKVQLPFGMTAPIANMGNRPVTLGCYAKNSHRVIDQKSCLVQDSELTSCAMALREWAESHHLSVYDEQSHEGLLRHALLRKGLGTGEILAGLVIHAPPSFDLPHSAAAIAGLQKALGSRAFALQGFVVQYNEQRTNVVLSRDEKILWGKPFLTENLDGLTFRLEIGTFFQVNPYQAPRLFSTATAPLNAGERVLDLYCGTGTFTLWAARRTGHAEGWEENANSIAAARHAAMENGLQDKVHFQSGDVAALLHRPDFSWRRFDVALVDPPRKGLEATVIASLLEDGPSRVIYVSCNPNSLARDVHLLLPKYTPVELQPIDMMPHTRHIESVLVLRRNKA